MTDPSDPNKAEQEAMEDQRNYFRLSNTVGVAAYILDPATPLEHFADGYDPRLTVPPILSLLNQSREAQIDNNTILKQIRSKYSGVGRYLERLNERLDLLQQAILYIDKSFPVLSWQEAEYSEAGIDFLIPHTTSQYPSPLQETQNGQKQTTENVKVGNGIHLILGVPAADLILDEVDTVIFPKHHMVYQPHFSPAGYLSVLAHITAVDDETAAIRVGCSFDVITDFDRQFLARHILAVQSFRRRQSLAAD